MTVSEYREALAKHGINLHLPENPQPFTVTFYVRRNGKVVVEYREIVPDKKA